MNHPKVLEKLEADIKAGLYKLSEQQLRELCAQLNIDKDTEGKQHHGLVRHINRYIDCEEVESLPNNGKKISQDLRKKIKEMTGTPEEPTSTSTSPELKAALDLAAFINRKDF